MGVQSRNTCKTSKLENLKALLRKNIDAIGKWRDCLYELQDSGLLT